MSQALATIVFAVTFLGCLLAARVCLKGSKLTALLWITLAYYAFLSVYASLAPLEFRKYDLLAGRFGFSAEPLSAAILFAGCAAGLAFGEFGAHRMLERNFPPTQLKRPLIFTEFWALACVFLLAAAASLLIGGGGSYREYVSGASIGWGVTLAFIAGGAIGLALLTPCPLPVKVTLILIGALPSTMIALSTGVRILLLIPAGSLALSLVARGVGERRPVALIAALAAAVPVIALLNIYVLQPLRNSRETQVFFPESEVVVLYMRLVPHVEPGSAGPLDPLIRFFSGLLSYPAATLGIPLSMRADPATGFARAIQGDWASYFSHMPMTFALDFMSTAGAWAIVTATLFGTLFETADRILRSDFRLLIVFVPAVAVSQYLFARGAVSHAGAAISAAAFYGFAILATLALVRTFSRRVA